MIKTKTEAYQFEFTPDCVCCQDNKVQLRDLQDSLAENDRTIDALCKGYNDLWGHYCLCWWSLIGLAALSMAFSVYLWVG